MEKPPVPAQMSAYVERALLTAILDETYPPGTALPNERERAAIPGTPILRAELRWAAHAEGVVHLEDLFLCRVLADGGTAHLPAIRAICQSELGWSNTHWETEEQAYLTRVRAHYSVPQ